MSKTKTKKPVAAKSGKHGATRANRTAQLSKWVQDTLTGKNNTTRTSQMLAVLASKALAFEVTPNTMARELDKAGIPFRRVPGDPPKNTWSKTEIMRIRQANLEDRLRNLEMKVFGKVIGYSIPTQETKATATPKAPKENKPKASAKPKAKPKPRAKAKVTPKKK